MQTSKSRSFSSETAKRVSSRAARQVKPAAVKCESSSSSNQTGKIKERSPKVIGRSPRTPLSEKKCQNRVSELESQIFLLQKDLKRAKEQLNSSKLRKGRAQLDAEVSSMSSNPKESRPCSSELGRPKELQKQAQDDDQSSLSMPEVTQKQQYSVDSVAFGSLVSVIQQLKEKLRVVDESRAAQTKYSVSANEMCCKLNNMLSETLLIMTNLRNQLRDCEVSETQVQALINETVVQLENAKETVEVLGLDSTKAFENLKLVTLDIDESREDVNLLDSLVGQLEAAYELKQNRGRGTSEDETREMEQFQTDFRSLPAEVEQLKYAVEAPEAKPEEQAQSSLESENANLREVELKNELEKSKVVIEEFKAKLLVRETELQSISNENLKLNSKLEKSLSSHRVFELEKELDDLKNCIADLKANLLDKETEFQSVSEENEMLISKITKRERVQTKVKEEATTESVEKETQMKSGNLTEEVDRSSRKQPGMAELEAAQAANAEMETEMRKLKVQSEQWRKAAEAAAAMISAGSNGEFVGRTGLMDGNYNAITGSIGSAYSEEQDEELLRKKNGNVLRKIGVLWKKPQK